MFYLILAIPPLLLALALYADVIALRRSEEAMANRKAVGFSPRWFALAPLLLIGAIAANEPALRGRAPFYVLMGAHWIVGAWIVYRHRHWPKTAIGIVIATLLASYFLFALVGLGTIPYR